MEMNHCETLKSDKTNGTMNRAYTDKIIGGPISIIAVLPIWLYTL